MTLRIRFPEREDALRGNVEVVNDHDERVAIGHLEVDGFATGWPPDAGAQVQASLRFVGHVDAPTADPAASLPLT